MRVDANIIKLIVDSARDAGLDVRSYSGRAMYGAKCVGIEFDRDPYTPTSIVLDILQSFMDNNNMMQEDCQDYLYELMGVLKGAREDSMGLGGIIYWPDMEWSDSFNDVDRGEMDVGHEDPDD